MSKIGTEPELESMDDYNGLTGEKKRVVWTVIIVGILIGIGYTVASRVFTAEGDAIQMQDPINIVPVSKSISVK